MKVSGFIASYFARRVVRSLSDPENVKPKAHKKSNFGRSRSFNLKKNQPKMLKEYLDEISRTDSEPWMRQLDHLATQKTTLPGLEPLARLEFFLECYQHIKQRFRTEFRLFLDPKFPFHSTRFDGAFGRHYAHTTEYKHIKELLIHFENHFESFASVLAIAVQLISDTKHVVVKGSQEIADLLGFFESVLTDLDGELLVHMKELTTSTDEIKRLFLQMESYQCCFE